MLKPILAATAALTAPLTLSFSPLLSTNLTASPNLNVPTVSSACSGSCDAHTKITV